MHKFLKIKSVGIALLLSTTLTSCFLSNDELPQNWYERSKLGLFVHYVPELSIYPDGSITTDINEAADSFDVQEIADAAYLMGAEYVIFTSMHFRMKPLYPSNTMDVWRPGNSSTRDIIQDLLNELSKKGIKLILYVHSTDGHDFYPEDQIITGWNDSAHHYATWNNFVNDIFSELGNRYGADLEAVWLDMVSSKEYQQKINKPRIRASMLSGNPHRIVIGSFYPNGINPFYYGLDYTSEEYEPIPEVDTWSTYPHQIVSMAGGNWWADVPRGNNAAKYTPEQLYRFTVIQSSTTRDGGIAWGAGTYLGGGFEDGVYDMLTGLGDYIRPVAESIKGTVPSTSFKTPLGASIKTLPFGIAATKSPDDTYEYIHVLTPPSGNTLLLPAPDDKKIFGAATLLSNGHPVAIDQNGKIALTLHDSDAWSPVDTVIKLQVLRIETRFGMGRLHN